VRHARKISEANATHKRERITISIMVGRDVTVGGYD